jgi:glucose/arabinose dehydrogenase
MSIFLDFQSGKTRCDNPETAGIPMQRLFRLRSSQGHAGRRSFSFPLARHVETLEQRIVLSTLPAGFTQTLVTSQDVSPVSLVDSVQMEIAPDGRIFVTQKEGTLRIVNPDGHVEAEPFVSLAVDSNGEAGLLGVTLDPNFSANGYVYVYYTVPGAASHNRVSRFTADGNTAVPGSELILLELNDLSSDSRFHNGGALHFGLDGKLYVSVGENNHPENSQSLDTLLGKVLRINADGSIPTDNPFYNTATGVNRAIWSLGLRNPFTFAVQPGTGRIFINDVGAAAWEEINEGVPGANYGWPFTEGPTDNPNVTAPLFAYAHGETDDTGCAIIGGAFYNPAVPQFPADFAGDYFFADLCNGWLHRFDPETGVVQDFMSGVEGIVDIDVTADGSLYLLTRGAAGDAIFKIQYQPAHQGPTIVQQPQSQLISVGEPVTFTVVAAGTGTPTYRWQRDGVDIPDATGASYTLPAVVLADNGSKFQCVITDPTGSALSEAAMLSVTTNHTPVLNLISPALNSTYGGGDTFQFAAEATDFENGVLPPSAFTWSVKFQHDEHAHPFIPETSGNSGTFTIPTVGESSPNVWYRLQVTVTDSAGLSQTTFRDILPRTSTISLAANIPGLALTLDGQPVTSPSFVGVEGITRALGASSPQTLNGKIYKFVSWSDGGATIHDIETPSADTTYTATFQQIGIAPTIGVTSPPQVYTKGAPPMIVEPRATLQDPDSQNYAGGTLTVSLTGAVFEPGSVQRLVIISLGAGPNQIGVTGNQVTFGGKVIGTFSGGSGSTPLKIQLNSDATIAATRTLLRRIAFSQTGDNTESIDYNVTFQLTEGNGGTSNVATKTVHVLAVNNAPKLECSETTLSYRVGVGPVVIDPMSSVTDVDSANFEGGKLSVSIRDAKPGDQLGIRQTTGVGAVAVNGANVSVGGIVVGTVGGTPTHRVITFNAQSSNGAAQTLLRNITFQTTSNMNSQRIIETTLSDGDGGLSPVATKTISITSNNTASVEIKNGTLEVNAQGSKATILVTQLPDGRFAVVGIGTTLTLNSGGLVQIAPNLVLTKNSALLNHNLTIHTGDGNDTVLILDFNSALKLLGRPPIPGVQTSIMLHDVTVTTAGGTDRVILAGAQIAGTQHFDLGGQPDDQLEFLSPPAVAQQRAQIRPHGFGAAAKWLGKINRKAR